MAKVVVVISYDSDKMLYPERLLREVARGVHPIFERKTDVSISVGQEETAFNVLAALDIQFPFGSIVDPPIRRRNPYGNLSKPR